MDTSLTQRPRLRFSPPYPCCSIRPPRRRVDIAASFAAYLARALFPGQTCRRNGARDLWKHGLDDTASVANWQSIQKAVAAAR